jgi:hypothetical protein
MKAARVLQIDNPASQQQSQKPLAVTPEQIGRLLHVAQDLYSYHVSEEVAAIWLQALKGQTADHLRTAFHQHFAECKYFPRPAEILARVPQRRQNPERQAWTGPTDEERREKELYEGSAQFEIDRAEFLERARRAVGMKTPGADNR